MLREAEDAQSQLGHAQKFTAETERTLLKMIEKTEE